MRARLSIPLVLAALFLVGCNVNEGPPLSAHFVASVTEGPVPLTVYFDASGSRGAIRYEWDFGDGHTYTSTSPWAEHTFSTKGTFWVTLTVYDRLDETDATSLPIVVTSKPPVVVIDAPTEATSLAEVQFDSSGSYDPDGIIVSYHWDFGDGSVAEGPIVSHVYHLDCEGTTEPVEYTVTLTVTDNDGDTATATHTITIVPVCPLP